MLQGLAVVDIDICILFKHIFYNKSLYTSQHKHILQYIHTSQYKMLFSLHPKT
jgi:hypothetical protein